MKSLTDVISGIILLVLCGIGAWSVSTLPESGMEQLGPGACERQVACRGLEGFQQIECGQVA